MNYARLIPELAVSNCDTSVKFYCDILGFTVLYERKDEGFAFLERDGAQLMLDEIDKGRTWAHASTSLEKPLAWYQPTNSSRIDRLPAPGNCSQ